MVDCQTTGSSPGKGRVVEVAWSRGRGGDQRWGGAPRVASSFVRLPRGERLPPRIARLTGISPRDLAGAPEAEEVWGRLAAELRSLALAAPAGRAVAVAHFARFEHAFLEDWQRRGAEAGNTPGTPLDWLCTHEIAIRLLPGLPRRGLRAVAGHLGHVMAEERRARGHVRATVAVWRALLRRLADEGVATLAELRAWLEEEAPVRRGGREFTLPREERLALPDAPGVYRMTGRGGEVLYVGKATSLRRRVNSYFRTRHRRPGGERTLELLSQVWGVEVTPCTSRLEAALRENDAIKEHAPPYNVALREREPSVYFASADLGTVKPAARGKYRVGPLPRRDSLAAAWALKRLVRDGVLPSERAPLWAMALGFGAPAWASKRALEEHRFDERGLRAGLALFREQVGWSERDDVPAAELLRVGERLWREQLAEREAQRAERRAAGDAEPVPLEADEDTPPADESAPRDPEDVAHRLGIALGRCAQLVARGRWFLRLCESSLWWRSSAGDPQLLILQDGAVSSCTAVTDAPPGERAPVPPGASTTPLARRRAFTPATYDRLRVLTTELRRILNDGAEIELRLGTARPLGRTSLARQIAGV